MAQLFKESVENLLAEPTEESGAKQPSRVVQGKAARKKRKHKATPSQVLVKQEKDTTKKPSFLRYMLELAYKNLYILGASVLRRNRRLARSRRATFARIRKSASVALSNTGLAIGRGWRGFLRRLKGPFLRVKRTYQQERPLIAELRREKQIPWSSYWQITKQVLYLFYRVLATLLNHAAPVAGVIALAVAIGTYGVSPVESAEGTRVALQLTYQGKKVGYVENEQHFSEALQNVKDRVIALDGQKSDVQIEGYPAYTLVVVDKAEPMLKTDELADIIIQASSNQIDTAYGVYIDGELLGAVEDMDAVYNELESIKDAKLIGKANEKRPEIVNAVAIKQGLYPYSSLRDTKEVVSALGGYKTQEETYTVVDGDTPSGLASKLGIPYSDLKTMNPNIESDDFKVGLEIYTSRAVPYLTVKNIFTDTYLQELSYEVEEIENSMYGKSYRNVEVEGANGLEMITADITYINGVEMNRTELTRLPIISAVSEKVIIGVEKKEIIPTIPAPGTTSTASGTSGATTGAVPGTTTAKPPVVPPATNSAGFIWPTSGGYISCYLYGYPGHEGVDIAGNGGVGSPVYASASGTVVKAINGYYGYGKYIVIDHGNGYTTLYAHNDLLRVQVGEYVVQGQQIANSGRTGRVTGPHVHFEVRYNGAVMNPMNYIG